MKTGVMTGCVFCFVLGFLAQRTAPAAVVLEVQAGACDREGVPVEADLPADVPPGGQLELIRLDTQQPVPVQVVAGTPPRLVWMIDERLAAGKSRRYRLATSRVTSATENPVTAVQTEGRVLLKVGPLSVLQYHVDVLPSADPEQPYFARSGFIHPVFDPQKRMLTDAMPPDHLHQHGIMFAWVKTTFEERSVDFWNSKKQEGEIRHVALENVVSGPVLAGFSARLEHLDRTAPGGPKPVLNETWDVRVYRRSAGFLFDLRSVQTCAGASRLVLNKNLYGGLCVRGNSAWLERDQGDFLTSDGKTREDGNHTRPDWVDVWGKLDGNPSGITSFCHPENFRAPQPVRLHPTKPYMCWSPCVLDDFAIEPGQPYTSCYRFFVHAGKLDVGVVRSLWSDYSQPAKVIVVAESPTSR